MEKIRIIPTKLKGTVLAPSSKSMGHREIICAGLAEGTSVVDNISMSKDIEATCRCLRALGVTIEDVPSKFAGRSALKVTGTGKLRAAEAGADCGESGSTLRFFIPLGALLGEAFTFTGHGKLVSRPLNAYYDIFDKQGLKYQTAEEGHLPLTVNGRLQAGLYQLPGNVSSQYVSGLLFALPLLENDSVIEITSELESSAYVDMTLSCLKKYGIEIVNENDAHRRYLVRGGQKYQAMDSNVEGDWSQAAFWTVGGSLGEAVICSGVDYTSLQGDKAVVPIMEGMAANIKVQGTDVVTDGGNTKATVIDAANCPDIIPVLTVLAAVSEGTTEIINAGRLRIKECDRLSACAAELARIGMDTEETADTLTVHGAGPSTPVIPAGTVFRTYNDHRLAMSCSLLGLAPGNDAVVDDPAVVRKSFPGFWKEWEALL